MTVRQARSAMIHLDAPYLADVLERARQSRTTLLGIALAFALDDGEISNEEALGLAALAYLLQQVEREGEALANVTGRAASSVVPLAYREGANQAAAIVRGIGASPITPFTTSLALAAQNALRTRVLGSYGADSVAVFKERLGDALTRVGLRSAVVEAIEHTFGADAGVDGQMTRRALIVVRQSNYDVYRSAMIETYRLSLDDAGYWVWRARLDGRSCAACVALSGRVFPLSRAFEHAHTGCRCMPQIIRHKADAGETGQDWLRRQSTDVQRQILGVRGAELFRAGDVELGDFVRLKKHPIFGPSYRSGGVAWAERKAARRAG